MIAPVPAFRGAQAGSTRIRGNGPVEGRRSMASPATPATLVATATASSDSPACTAAPKLFPGLREPRNETFAKEGMTMTKLTRRTVMKGGTALTAGMAGIIATGRAPAIAQQTTVHWLRWNDFVPASDQLLRKELLPEAEKALGIEVNFETVNGNELQPRVTASVQSGGGPDSSMVFNKQSALY